MMILIAILLAVAASIPPYDWTTAVMVILIPVCYYLHLRSNYG